MNFAIIRIFNTKLNSNSRQQIIYSNVGKCTIYQSITETVAEGHINAEFVSNI